MFVTLGDGAKSGFGLVRQNNGAEVVLVAGQTFKTQPRISRFPSTADVEYEAQEFKITGIYEQDNINVRKHFGEEFQIVPIGNGSHYLTVLPHAVGVPDIKNTQPPAESLTEARTAARNMEAEKQRKIERMGQSELERNVRDALAGAPSSSTVMNALNSGGTP